MRLSDFFPKRTPDHPKTVREDDTFIVSYPKSGNTWQRFLVANLVRPNEEITFATINRIVPDIYPTDEADLARLPSPRIMKSHEAFTPRYRKAIYITRDPRSVAVSMYHFYVRHGKLGADHSMDKFLRDFVRGAKSRQYRSWGDNVMSWVSRHDQGDPSILLLRYEDLKQEPVAQLRRVAQFMGIPAGEADLLRAVEKSSFERMQALEDEGNKTMPAPKWDTTKRFVRKGEMDEWKRVLTPEQTKLIGRKFARPMRRMGYC